MRCVPSFQQFFPFASRHRFHFRLSLSLSLSLLTQVLLVLKKESKRERERGDSLSLSLSVSQRAPARFFRVEREKKSVLRKARMYYVRFESCKGLLKMNPKMLLFFFRIFFFVCVSFFIGFKVSCDTLNTFEKKREVFFLRCHVVCVFIV